MDIPIYPGSSSFTSIQNPTPFGFYNDDPQFQIDADKVALFCARRLGYPLVEVELQDVNFYAAFEQAVTTYGNEVYAYKVRQDYLSLEGAPTGSALNHSLITPNMGNIIRLSNQYGTEAGVGGDVELKEGIIHLTSSVQDYDLNAWAQSNNITGSDMEIRKIFYESPPAITKYFDPYAGTGTGMMNFIDQFGWGNYSPAINFLLMPISFDLQKLQAIEFNDTIRKSNYSFEIHNNKIRIFPIPVKDHILKFQYILKSERLEAGINQEAGSSITNISNVPYINPKYSQINSIGRSWIFEYSLALSKEMLGYIRGKYSRIPIPESEVTLNSNDLITSAKEDKTALIEKLKNYLDETSRDKLLERRTKETEFKNKELSQVPYVIYIG